MTYTRQKADNGTNVQQYKGTGGNNQKFKLVSDGNGYYTIYTGASNYKSCLDVYNWSRDNGANINQWQYHGGDCQKFQLVKIGDAYAIKTKISDCYSCLDVYEQNTADGANINQWSYWGGKCQLWYLESTSGSSSSSSSSSSSDSNYQSIFWGSSTASAWGQDVSAMTSKNGGSFNAYDIQSNGYFYVEYSGNTESGRICSSELVRRSRVGKGFTKRNRHSKRTLLRKVFLQQLQVSIRHFRFRQKAGSDPRRCSKRHSNDLLCMLLLVI